MRVLLADDHRIVREGLQALLTREPGITVVGEVDDGRAAIAAVREHSPDVVVMDLSMPGLNGVAATQTIVAEFPLVRVLCLSMHADRHMVAAALQAGASGYLLKGCAATEVIDALRTVADNHTYLSPAIADGVVHDYVEYLTAGRAIDEPPLTTREGEILQLISEGHATKDIAEELSISKKTVATHREHIMAKLDLHSVADLTKYAIRRGMTTIQRQPAR